VHLAASPVTELAPAKINLALHVTGRRLDGYHELESLVVFTELGDRISASATANDQFEVDGPFAASVPLDGQNIVVKARETMRAFAKGHLVPDWGKNVPLWRQMMPGGGPAMAQNTASWWRTQVWRTQHASTKEIAGSVSIRLTKNLPIASGIGGGSSDAAATLIALNRVWMTNFIPGRLTKFGQKLGADVPMCLVARPLVARGTGDIIAPLDGFPRRPMVLVNPGVPVATPAVFAALSARDNPPLPPLPRNMDFRSLLGWLCATRNDLEAAATAMAPPIAEALQALRAGNAAFARMSGSGATCFGLFETPETAMAAADTIRRTRPGWFVAATSSTA
jgi:4-diphosphocytidyl-2-C-methyl-D-erythritol kinase